MRIKTIKKTLSLMLALTLVFALAACGGAASSAAPASVAASTAASTAASAAASTAAPAPATDKLVIGMLLPGTINDQGWNAAAFEGLKLIEDKLGADVNYTEKVAPSDYEETFRGYAEMGCNIVYGHGYEFGEAALAVAPEFPETMFIVTSADFKAEPNVASLQNRNNEQGFMAGVVAALHSKSGIVGTVGGMEIPSITLFMEGFEDGAKYINPDIKVLSVFTGSFDDVAKAKSTALAMIKEGADVVTHDADQAGLGVFEAAMENDGVLAVGSVGDQYEQAPEKIITSATNKLGGAILLAAEKYLDGSLEPIVYQFGVAEGVVGLADFRDFPVTDENKATIEEIMEKIISGEIVVEYRPTTTA